MGDTLPRTSGNLSDLLLGAPGSTRFSVPGLKIRFETNLRLVGLPGVGSAALRHGNSCCEHTQGLHGARCCQIMPESSAFDGELLKKH